MGVFELSGAHSQWHGATECSAVFVFRGAGAWFTPALRTKEGTMNRFIGREVRKKIEANRQRAADVLEREQREQEAIRLLNRKTNGQAGGAKNG
jgi:hypothetical protein